MQKREREINYLLYEGSYEESCEGGWWLVFHTIHQKGYFI